VQRRHGADMPHDDQRDISTSDTGQASGLNPLAVELSSIARDLSEAATTHDTLVAIVQAAVALVPGCDEGSISVVLGRSQVTSEAASGDLPRRVDELQERLGQGPCLDAVYEQETVRVSHMALDERWPVFAPLAVAEGAAAMLSFQLYVADDNLGALNLFSRSDGAFDDEAEQVGLLFAAHAAVAYAAARKQSAKETQVATRQLIGQAQGILMERYKVTGDKAFRMLILASQKANTKLRAVAEQIVYAGE
jgi:hypothetical protein